MNYNVYGELQLNSWQLDVRLGVTDEERLEAQSVAIDIAIRFAKLPPACTSDRLTDTVCYDTLLSRLRPYLAKREYHLLENLAYAVYQKIHELLAGSCQLRVKVTKLHPPIADLAGASFIINDY